MNKLVNYTFYVRKKLYTKMKKEDPDEEEETRRDYIRFADNSTNKKHKPQTQKSHMSIQLWCLFVFGILSGFGSATWLRLNLLSCSNLRSCCPNGMLLEELLHDNQFNSTENNVVFTDVPPEKSLVFVGVMTAQKYLDTRARAVYETWGRKIPGRISFFSRSGSSSKYDIPLVSLPGVDDVSHDFELLICCTTANFLINSSEKG